MIGRRTVALVMIVRDEAERIRACLESALPLVDHWTILDTGSSDATPDIVRESMAGVPGKLWRRDWQGFAKSRSLAFRKARGTADWLLLLDADMRVECDDGFEPDAERADSYLIEMGAPGYSWRLPLLVRGDLPWESRGTPVTGRHAVTLLPDGTTGRAVATDGLRIRRGDSWSRRKGELLVEDLERDLAAAPDDPRVVFYLAQALSDVGRHAEAFGFYNRRAGMGGFPEEAFYAAHRAALMLSDPAQRLASLLRAWEMRPHRLEPLHAAVRQLNEQGMHWTAYALSNIRVDPPGDVLFVHGDVWAWGMAFERSVAALSIGRLDEGLALCRALLDSESTPQAVRERVEANMAAAGAASAPPVP